MSAGDEGPGRPNGGRGTVIAGVVVIALALAGVTAWGLRQRQVASDLQAELDQRRTTVASSRSEPSDEGAGATSNASESPRTSLTERASRPIPPPPRSCPQRQYHVAFQGPLSGQFAPLGQGMLNGVRLAVKEAEAGTLSLPSGAAFPPGIRLGVKRLDTQGSPERAPAVASEAAEDPSVVAVIPAFSGEIMASGEIYNAARIPFVTATGTAPGVTRNGWRNFFRIAGDDNQQAAATVRFVRKGLDAKRVAVVTDGAPYGANIGGRFATGMKRSGGRVVASITVDASTSFKDATGQIAASDVDAVYFGGYYTEAGKLRKALISAEVDVPFVSDDGAFDVGFFDAAGLADDGSYVLYPGTDVSRYPTAFVDAYRDKFSAEPGAFSLETYGATALVLDAIANVGCKRAAIRAHLAKTNATVATTTVRFRRDGQIRNPLFTVYSSDLGQWTFHDTVTAEPTKRP